MANDEDGNQTAGNAFDPATLLGLIGALGLVGAALYLGAAPQAFVDVPSIPIVLGGTSMLIMASFTVADMGVTVGAIVRTVSYQRRGPSATATELLRLTDNARCGGRCRCRRRCPRARSPIRCCTRG